MTQKDKELLLKDLCARLPYGVKCKLIYNNKAIKDEDATLFSVDKYAHFLFAEFGEDVRKFVCKPYLFPLSSMTEEQKKEWRSLMIHDSYGILYPTIKSFDYLYKNHIDIRGLIPKGLAIDCTNLNIY